MISTAQIAIFFMIKPPGLPLEPSQVLLIQASTAKMRRCTRIKGAAKTSREKT
jgi:hypothetical protein